MAGYATSGRGWHNPAVAGLLRRDERVHAQSIELADCLCRVIASIGGYFPGDCADVVDGLLPSSPEPVAYPKSGWWPAPPRSPGERCPLRTLWKAAGGTPFQPPLLNAHPRLSGTLSLRRLHVADRNDDQDGQDGVVYERDRVCCSVLLSGRDFYSSPRLSPDGSRLAWLS